MITGKNPGAEIGMLRDQTARQASMPGVTEASFICVGCGQPRNVRGRVQVVKGTPKFGWICVSCQCGGASQ